MAITPFTAAIGFMLTATVTAVALVHADLLPGGQHATEFRPLFDGKTFAGWHGDYKYWSIRDGALTGGFAQDIPEITFLIHEGRFRNFELRFKYRFPVPGNSGLNFRSRPDPDQPFEVTGYQANVVTVPPSALSRYANIHEHNGSRPTLADLGQRTRITRVGNEVRREVLDVVNPPERVLAADRPYPEWNEQVVIAYENRFVSILNGLVTADVTDDDVEGRFEDGFIALQVHSGPPMEVQFKDLEIRTITAMPDLASRLRSDSLLAAHNPAQNTGAAVTSGAPAAGRTLFAERCAPCHEMPGSDAPQRAALAGLATEQIVDALVQGLMKAQAAGLTRAEIEAIAAYVKSGTP